MILGRKAHAVLAWLASRGIEGGPRNVLVDMLWAEGSEGDARNALRQCLFQMRRAMGVAAPLHTARDTLGLAAPGIEVDLWDFIELARSNRMEDRIAACALYGGDFGQDLHATAAFDSWIALERERVRRAAAALVEQCAPEASDATEVEAVAGLARRILAADPLHEGCWRALMLLHARAGMQARVRAVWDECRHALRVHAGREPSAVTLHLCERAGGLHEAATAPVLRETLHLSLGRHLTRSMHPAEAAAAAHDHSLRATFHYFNGSPEDNAAARSAWDAAAGLEPHRCDYATLAAWTHFTDFNYAFNGPPPVSYLLAASKCRALLGRFPQDAWPRALHAKLLLWRGDFGGALDFFNQAMAIAPETPALWANMADALVRVGRPREALDYIRVAMDLQPDDRGYFPFLAGNAHFALGNLDAALAAYGSSVRRNPGYCVSFRGIAAVQAELGRPDEAREAMSRSRLVDVLAGAMHVLGPYAQETVPHRWSQAWLTAGLRPIEWITSASPSPRRA